VIEPVNWRDAGEAGTWFGREGVSSVARQGASVGGCKGRSAWFWLLADAGFDGRDVVWTDVVPLIRCGGRLRAALVKRAKASSLHGQHWKVETVVSVIGRKFVDGVRSRQLWLACCAVLAKGVVYNWHRCLFIVVGVGCMWWSWRGGCR
jgi:hypothetical protein